MLLSKTFILTEVDDLIFDLIILMIVIALLDNVFFSKVTSVEEIYRTRVHAPRHSLEFKWHPDKLKAPIFRQAERTGTGIETSPTSGRNCWAVGSSPWAGPDRLFIEAQPMGFSGPPSSINSILRNRYPSDTCTWRRSYKLTKQVLACYRLREYI
jgi:hypothetical protein